MLVQSVSVFGMDTSHLVQALFDMYPMHGTPTTLKSLTLAGIQVHSKEHAFSWPTSSFSGLVELDLNDLVGFASPLLNDLVTLLSNCRALNTLRLQGVNIHSNQREAHRAISLPQLRLLELGLLENNEGMRQLVELLSPGSHALDFRLHLASLNYNGLAPHIRSLLTRSNTAYLTLKDFHSNSGDHFRSILSAAPHLRALLLHDVSLSIGLNIFDGMLTPINGLAKRFPQLQCLCLIFGDLSPAVIGQLERIATLSNIRNLVLWSCRFWKPPSSEPDDSDEEDSNGERWSPHLPQSARQLLLGRFEKVIVQDTPLSRVRQGIDLSIQNLITFD
ncbi:hypothetical protein FRC12_024323 [Ceratobasidium sp. 428]|nr:hypothetical protein FRC12_024323 [Ceratobasidium sp. 428]